MRSKFKKVTSVLLSLLIVLSLLSGFTLSVNAQNSVPGESNAVSTDGFNVDIGTESDNLTGASASYNVTVYWNVENEKSTYDNHIVLKNGDNTQNIPSDGSTPATNSKGNNSETVTLSWVPTEVQVNVQGNITDIAEYYITGVSVNGVSIWTGKFGCKKQNITTNTASCWLNIENGTCGSWTHGGSNTATTTSSHSTNVTPVNTSIVASVDNSSINCFGLATFSASVVDQYGQSLGSNPTMTYSALPSGASRSGKKVTFPNTMLSDGSVTMTASYSGFTSRTATVTFTSHTFGTPSYSWSGTSGCTASRTCSRCGYVHSEDAVITSSELVAPTCTENGTTHYTATFEHSAFETQTKDAQDINAINHDYDYDNAVYNWNGYSCSTAIVTCKNDSSHKIVVDTNVSVESLKQNCVDDGYDKYTAAFTVDGTEYKDVKTHVIPADGHSYNYYDNGDDTHYGICSVCGDRKSDLPHTFGNDGICSLCGAINSYTITWVNSDGTVLETDTKVQHGTTPTFDGEQPSKEADAQYTYIFNGWSPAVTAATGDATYTAQYILVLNQYNIKFVNYDGTELQTEVLNYGATPSYRLSELPTKPADAQYTYTFSGWSPEINDVVGEAIYTAQYSSTINKYTVTFLNDDGTELQSGLWEYGSTPVYSGSTPEKASTAEFDYTFAGWDREIDEVTGDTTYTATYTSSTRGYTVEWRDWDNSLIEKDENVLYNTVPAFDGETPEREADAHYSYTFKGWNPAVSKVTGNTVYTAAYNLVPQKYTITFKNEDGTVLETKQVDYGTEPGYTGDTPAKAYTNRFHYTFNNVWSPEITIVTGDAEYTAQFTESRHSYSYYFNGSYHWQKCSCGYTTAQTAHVLDADGTCICGYDKHEMADYTKVEELIDNAPKSIYFTEESYAALIAAEDAVDRTYDIGRQAEVDAMADSIRTAIDNLEPISHTVRVTSGSVNQSVIKSVSRYYYVATVSAPKTNGSGQKFSYWEKTDGTKVATYRNYSFLVTEDITLRPVYGVSKDSADFPLYASRVIDIRDNGDKTHSILVEHSASTAVERITGHGVLITTDPSIGTNKDAMITTNEEVQDFAANKSARTLTGLFEIPVTFNTPGTVYARSYIIDSEGIVHLGEIYSFTVNSASTSAYDEELIAVDSVETVVEQNEAEEVTDEPAQTGSVWETVLNILMTVIARIFNFIKASAAIIKF